MTHDVAIAHDQFTTLGGAERVALELARTFDAPIYAAAVNETLVPEDVEVRNITSTGVGARAMNSHYLLQDAYQMLAWQHVEELYTHDVVVQNKNNPGWFVPKDDQTVVKYTHSTPRGAYDKWHQHGDSMLNRLLKMPMRALYRQNIDYVDAWVCNSELIQRRIRGYWDIDPERINVIYPPVDTESFGPEHGAGGDYYFTYSRLRGHKRIDEIVRAFNTLPAEYHLVVGGDGPEREHLAELAGDSVDVVGYLSEAEKRQRLAEAKAVVFAAENEDFGMVPIEAFASGTPVIGVESGYTQHQVVDGANGLLWNRGELPTALRRFEQEGVAWSPERIQRFAERFNGSVFRRQMHDLVDAAVDQTEVSAPWEDEQADAVHPPAPAIRPDGGDS